MQGSVLSPMMPQPRACRHLLGALAHAQTCDRRHGARQPKAWQRARAAAFLASAPFRDTWRSLCTAERAAKLIWATRNMRIRGTQRRGAAADRDAVPLSASSAGELSRALRLAEAFQRGLDGTELQPAQARYALAGPGGGAVELTALRLMEAMTLSRCAILPLRCLCAAALLDDCSAL